MTHSFTGLGFVPSVASRLDLKLYGGNFHNTCQMAGIFLIKSTPDIRDNQHYGKFFKVLIGTYGKIRSINRAIRDLY